MTRFRCGCAMQAGLRVLAMLSLLSAACPSRAGLGDTEASVHNDRDRMQGQLHSEDRPRYRLYSITAPTGTEVREFVGPGGKVFGIAWEGRFHPDLQQLLGPHFRQAQEMVGQQPRVRGAPVRIETPDLVIYESGHMRSFHGRAWLPRLVPPGVSHGDIR